MKASNIFLITPILSVMLFAGCSPSVKQSMIQTAIVETALSAPTASLTISPSPSKTPTETLTTTPTPSITPTITNTPLPPELLTATAFNSTKEAKYFIETATREALYFQQTATKVAFQSQQTSTQQARNLQQTATQQGRVAQQTQAVKDKEALYTTSVSNYLMDFAESMDYISLLFGLASSDINYLFNSDWKYEIKSTLASMRTTAYSLANIPQLPERFIPIDKIFNNISTETVSMEQDLLFGINNFDVNALENALSHMDKINALVDEGITLTKRMVD